MYKFMIDETKDNYSVYVNAISSSAGTYLSRWPHVFALLSEVLAKSKLKGDKLTIEKNLGRNIGRTDIVSTDDTDTIYYAQKPKSDVYLRFAKNRHSQLSSDLTITVSKDDLGDYEVVDVWIGKDHPPFPGDDEATDYSAEYWKNHALVQDAYTVQSKSITKVCPY